MRRWGVIKLLLIPLLALTPSAAEQKPTVEREMRVTYMPPPPTVGEMVAAADAVVVARYVDATFGIWDDRVPLTVHEFEILDVIRAHERLTPPGSRIELELLGGERELSEYIEQVTVRGTRAFFKDRAHVLLLRWLPESEKFELSWGPAAAYEVAGAQVRSLSDAPGRHDGKPMGEFLGELGVREISPAFR
jgi:hypothetical protein